ncbi:MAG: hypothetical protein IKD74_06215 [Clostridia bacterium]|nr:hypothetical protein [Clostridia bacterium]
MYRKANISDIENIVAMTNNKLTKQEIVEFIQKGQNYLYVYEQENSIVGATFFGAQDIEEYDYDSEVFGLYTKNSKDKDMIHAELLFDTKKELFNMGYRKLVIWADETDEKLRKSLQSSGGKEIKQRENEGSIQIAYSYDLVDLSEMEKDVE